MTRCRRHASNCIHDVCLTDCTRLLPGPTLCQLRHRRGTRHGGHAAFGTKADLANPSGVHLDRKLQNVAACWILDAYLSIGVGKLAGVARSLEVIEKLGRIHGRKTLTSSLPRQALPVMGPPSV